MYCIITVFHAIYCISCNVLYFMLMYFLLYLKPEPACAAIIPWLIDHLWVGFGSTGSPPSPSATLAIRPRDSTADASPSVSGTPGLFKDGLQPTPVVFGGKNESFGKDGIRTHGHCVSLCLSERSINCAMVPWGNSKGTNVLYKLHCREILGGAWHWCCEPKEGIRI